MDAKSIHSYDILWPISAFCIHWERGGERPCSLYCHMTAPRRCYAHLWAYGRNPRYYDYEGIGGDCTNFASQCIYAGAGVMNDTPGTTSMPTTKRPRGRAWSISIIFSRAARRPPARSQGSLTGAHPAGRYRAALVRRRRLAAFAGRRGGGPSAQLCGHPRRRA